MNILCLGDIYGKEGVLAVQNYIESNREKYDFIVVNGENSSHGFGITEQIAESLFKSGVDVITTGNHIWNKRDIYNYISSQRKLIRPLNYSTESPGNGYVVLEAKGEKIAVINAQGSVFMHGQMISPFIALNDLVTKLEKDGVKNIIVDFHAEATSEKIALGKFLDGRVSIVFGTHTHVQTNDAQILSRGTGYCTDLGMCGPHSGVIGVDKDVIIGRFLNGMPNRFTPAKGEVMIHGIEATIESGLCKKIELVKEYVSS